VRSILSTAEELPVRAVEVTQDGKQYLTLKMILDLLNYALTTAWIEL
jgi:hypothetical protein